MTDTVILELQQLGKDFHNSDSLHVRAVHELDLTLGQGESVGIVGESGCGKSTLARLICRLLPADRGTMLYKDNNITSLRGRQLKSYYQQVQMIFQDPLGAFSPRMKIGAYLMEPFLNFRLLKRRDVRAKAAELLERVGLEATMLKKYPNELSGGQLQRVVIARAVGLEPEIILCDESTSALDVSIQAQILRLLRDLKTETGFSCMFITHDIALAEDFCDRIYVMYQGKIVEILRADNLARDARHPYTRMLVESIFSVKHFNRKKQVPEPRQQTNSATTGCAFVPRCPEASPECFARNPRLTSRGTVTAVACHNN